MDALTLLLTRHSQPRLTQPAPSGMTLENIKQAALRAPDHAGLKPWEFIVCTDEGLSKLGEIFKDSALKSGKGQESIDRALQLPHRAPMVIVAIAKYVEHEKVPQRRANRCNRVCRSIYANGCAGSRFCRYLAQRELCPMPIC